jgi:NADH-quinone oxidoreductase subunit N
MQDHPSSMPVGDLLPEIVLLVGAVAVLLFALLVSRSRQGWASWLALAALGATAVAALPMLRGTQRVTFFDTYAADDTAVHAKIVVLAVTAVAVLLSTEWFRHEPRQGEYYSLLLFSALGAIVLAAAADLMELILGVLLSSLTGYALTAYHRASPRSTEAGIKYYLLSALTNGAMLYGAVIVFGLGATTTFTSLRRSLPDADPLGLAFGASLVILGLALKMGAVPTHAWMPDVADGAPAPFAAFVTTAPKIGALIALARLVSILPETGIAWRPLVAVVAAATMTLGNLAALWQDDVRRLLGWSAVSQSGYGLLAVVALGRSNLAVPSLLYFLVAYAAANLAAFGVVVELRGLTDRQSYAGLGASRPLLGACLLVALLSLIGIPPLAGFAAKLTLFGAAIDAGYTWLAALAVANTVISLFYYLRILAPAYLEPAEREVALLGQTALGATAASAASVIVLGIAAEPLLQAFELAQLAPT